MAEIIKRFINLNKMVANKSYFLFGPRQTGKSTMIKDQLPKKYKVYNLLESDTFTRLAHSPQLIRRELNRKDKVIVIDEIQKLPILLNEVHLLIEESGINFLLTGSSARALKRKGVNLLGGRARTKRVHPFVSIELKEKFSLDRALNYGLLPSLYFSDAPKEDLRSYVGEYLQEEIAAEAVVRNIGAFSRFLEVAALCNSRMVNYTEVSNDAQVPVNTVREYFRILYDTLIGFELLPFKETVKRKPIVTPKFYFFDIGVAHHLQKRIKVVRGTPEYGDAFETFIVHELRSYCDYNNIDDLHYWRSKSQFEVDFILNRKTAIEVKSKVNISRKDLKDLQALKEENILDCFILISFVEHKQTIDGIEILPWKDFLKNLWSNQYV